MMTTKDEDSLDGRATLHDVLRRGERAAAAGTPLVTNWPQVRASLLLIDRGIGLDTIPASNFNTLLPESFNNLDEEMQQHFPPRRGYPGADPRRHVGILLSQPAGAVASDRRGRRTRAPGGPLCR